jgi:hypothetical protein
MQRVGHQDPKLFTTEVGAVVELRKLLFAMATVGHHNGEIMDKNHGLYTSIISKPSISINH